MEEIKYTEEEIFDLAYWIMNEGYLPDMEAGDIQSELLNAENLILPGVPYLFTMVEKD